MQQLTNKELNQTYGGISINGTLINAFMKGINTFLDHELFCLITLLNVDLNKHN